MLNASESVSYTHLDVYKRQLQDSNFITLLCIMRARPLKYSQSNLNILLYGMLKYVLNKLKKSQFLQLLFLVFLFIKQITTFLRESRIVLVIQGHYITCLLYTSVMRWSEMDNYTFIAHF